MTMTFSRRKTRVDRRRRIAAAAALLAMVAGLTVAACGSDDGSADGDAGTSSARIGVILQAEVPVFNEMVAGFRDGFAAAAEMPVDNVELDVENAQGDATLIQTIARQLVRDDYDELAAIGSPAVVSLADLEDTTPIIAVAMTDPVGSGVAESLDQPGGNVTGSSDAVAPEAVADYLAALEPRPERVGTILDPANDASAFFLEGIEPLLEEQGIELVDAAISGPGDVSAAARSLRGRVDVIALTGDAVVTGVGLPAITSEAIAGEIPLVIAAGIDPDTRGVLATLSPDNHELGMLAGELGGRIFRDEADPETTAFARIPPQVAVNERTEKLIGVTAPTSIPE